jgi:uncharacterized protein (TIGR02147 family)
MSIFDYDDYKKWVRDSISNMPKDGRGQLKKIADHLGTSPTIVTQVFGGNRELTPEQALLLADFFALSKIETRFLILLVHFSRAGTYRYRQNLKEEIDEMRIKSREISNRVKQNYSLNEEAKSVFYSNWYFLAIWSLTAIEGFNNLDKISTRLGLNKKKAREAIDFLLKYSLIIEDDKQNLQIGPTLIHLESGSPQIPRHHQNWRLQAFTKYENPKNDNASYTAAVTLSTEDVKVIRENLLKFISENVNIIKNSSSEKLYCLCLDWFEV